MTRARLLLDTAAASVLATAVWLFHRQTFLNYDTFYALVWGDDLVHGRLPSYEVPLAPTPHPLATAVGALVSPLGEAAEGVLIALVIFAIGWLCVGMFRLGEALFAWPIGLLAAAIVATRMEIVNHAVRGYLDLPAAALIVWAAVLEARSPRRGAPVLLLLLPAGLLRPEAWLFAGAYWLWLAPALRGRERAGLGALAAAAPAIWMLSDLLVTGNPLWSLAGTHETAATLARESGLDAVAAAAPRRLVEILRLPVLVASIGGLVAGLALFAGRTLLPVAMAVVNGLAFAIFAVAGLPLLGRYVFVAAAMLALLAAVAVLGWSLLPSDHPARRRWVVGGTVALVAIAAYPPPDLVRLADSRVEVADGARAWSDLQGLLERPQVEAALARSRPVYVPNHRPVPRVAYWRDSPGAVVSARLERPSSQGLFLAPANPEVERLVVVSPTDPRRLAAGVPGDYRRVAANRSWVLYAGRRSTALVARRDR